MSKGRTPKQLLEKLRRVIGIDSETAEPIEEHLRELDFQDDHVIDWSFLEENSDDYKDQ